MEKATREKLAKIAKDMAQVPFHGDVDGMASNLASISVDCAIVSNMESQGS